MSYHTGASGSTGPAALVTEERNLENRLGIAEVKAGHPSPLLAAGVVLIDTPGVGSTFLHSLAGINSSMLLAFHKPYGVLSQFTPVRGSRHRTLAEFGFPPGVYPLGRLDAESEGLLLLSDERALNARLLDPVRAHARIYWAQVERIPSAEALRQLERGLTLAGRRTLPCRAWLPEPQPAVAPRDPPIRVRKTVPDCWLALELVEGKYHQVRRMTAHIGHPTLRLLRVQIGRFVLGKLTPGTWRELDTSERTQVLTKQ